MGKLTYANGDIFKGFFKDNWLNGKGKFIKTNGDIYEGTWELDLKQGKFKVTRNRKTTWEFYEYDNLVYNPKIKIIRF